MSCKHGRKKIGCDSGGKYVKSIKIFVLCRSRSLKVANDRGRGGGGRLDGSDSEAADSWFGLGS